jgi:hypothetical protein
MINGNGYSFKFLVPKTIIENLLNSPSTGEYSRDKKVTILKWDHSSGGFEKPPLISSFVMSIIEKSERLAKSSCFFRSISRKP